VPSREHPLVWTRRDGRKSLFIGATAGEVVGRPAAEGRALLDRILAWATAPQFTLRHRWRVGDLVIWDNTGMLHRAHPYGETSRRLMHRTTIAGTEAVQ
jgi:alpha-ketoglutarate-dependent taurine dioxygenase